MSAASCSSRFPGQSVFGVLMGLSGLHLGLGGAIGLARRREERTWVLTWQDMARMEAGVVMGGQRGPKIVPWAPPQKKQLLKNDTLFVSLKSSKTNRQVFKLSFFSAFKNGFWIRFLSPFVEPRLGTFFFLCFLHSITDFGPRLQKPSFLFRKTKLSEAPLGPSGALVGPLKRSFVVPGDHLLHQNSFFSTADGSRKEARFSKNKKSHYENALF